MSTSPSRPHGPLDGLVVLDFSHALAGPFATLLLAGLGARVIKVEAPSGQSDPARRNAPFAGRDGVTRDRRHDDDISLAILERTRGKQAITLDLKHPSAPEVIADLARVSDVVVQNWSPGVAERLGVDYPTLAAHNRRIVVCAITGFGLDPATAGHKAMDSIIQAVSGLMMAAGRPGDPPVLNGVPLADLVTPLFAVIGAVAAVREAERTGTGQLVDVSMQGAMAALVATEAFGAYDALGFQSRPGNSVPRLAPFGIFATSDGYVAVCAPTDAFAHALLGVIAGGTDVEGGRFADRTARVSRHAELHELVEAWTSTRRTDDVLADLGAAGVPVAPVRTPGEAVSDPAVLDGGDVAPLVHPRYGEVPGVVGSGVPIRFSLSDVGHDPHTPDVGEDNELVYRGLLGYTEAELAALRADGVI